MNNGDISWVLTSSAFVFIMLPGLALFYGGLVRNKNVLATIMHSFIALAIVGIVWVLWGYSLAFGPSWEGIIGSLEWFGLRGVSATETGPYSDTIPHQAFMIFQAKFAIITPALIAGAFAERIKFKAFVLFIILWSTLVYAPAAHWMWGAGGWLAVWGAKDFAGGAVVHLTSGIAAISAALIIGKRMGLGRESMEPHNIPYIVLGAGLLWFGWFGFNGGSALAANGTAVSAFVATHISAAVATVTWVLIDWFLKGKPSVVGAATGAIAGLATITPAAGFVGPMPAMLIGLAAGALCYSAVYIKNRIQLDDSLDVFAVHGMGGIIGLISVALLGGIGFMSLAEITDLSRGEFLLRQLGAIGAIAAWSFGITTIILLALKTTVGLRVTSEEEELGLDLSEHGETA
jgi:Amt family ammonium transporter